MLPHQVAFNPIFQVDTITLQAHQQSGSGQVGKCFHLPVTTHKMTLSPGILLNGTMDHSNIFHAYLQAPLKF